MKNEATANVAEIKPKAIRKKSPETTLKQELRSLQKELEKVDAMVAKFDEMKEEVANAETRKAEIVANLDIVKADLKKVLGLD